jgi:hypothetical protein
MPRVNPEEKTRLAQALALVKEWSEAAPAGRDMANQMRAAIDRVKVGEEPLDSRVLMPLVLAMQDPVVRSVLGMEKRWKN